MTAETSNARGEVKVGDRVRATRDGSSYYRNGDYGTVLTIDRDGDFWVRWDNPIVPDPGHGWCIHPHNCALAAPPPADARGDVWGLVAKLAAHVRPTCSELWNEAQAFLAAEGVQTEDAEAKTVPVPTRVYLTDKAAVIVGDPQCGWDEEGPDAHNCDAMGCASIGPHVLARVPFTDERAMSQASEAQAQGGGEVTSKRDPYAPTDMELLRDFISVCRDMKPVGKWPNELVCAAIERLIENQKPFRFIAEVDKAPERGHNGRSGDADRTFSGPRTAPPSAPAHGTTLRFGLGAFIVNTGTSDGEPAVFVDAAPAPGPVGGKAPDVPAGTTPLLRLLFPSGEQAQAVCDALVNAHPRATVGVELSALRVQEWLQREYDILPPVQEIEQAMRTPCSCPDTERALAQQPAAVGEEIMVNAAHDVYTLPLQPSGLLSGPRFVVHVPAPEQQPAAPTLAKYQPCGCVICTCEDEQQCQGCGAKHCGNRADHPPYVVQQPAAVDGAVGTVTRVGSFEVQEHRIELDPEFDERLNYMPEGTVVRLYAAPVRDLTQKQLADASAALATQHQEPKSCKHYFVRDEDNGGACCQLCGEVKP